MQFKKIAAHYRVECPAGGTGTAPLPPSSGGRFIKSVNYMVEILAASSTNAKLGLALNHGPNGQVSLLHSTPITATSLTAGILLLSGDASSGSVIGEYLHPIISVSGTGAAEWVLFNVYETRKPF